MSHLFLSRQFGSIIFSYIDNYSFIYSQHCNYEVNSTPCNQKGNGSDPDNHFLHFFPKKDYNRGKVDFQTNTFCFRFLFLLAREKNTRTTQKNILFLTLFCRIGTVGHEIVDIRFVIFINYLQKYLYYSVLNLGLFMDTLLEFPKGGLTVATC